MSSTAFYMRQEREGGRQRTLWQGAAAGGAFASWCDMWRQIEVMYVYEPGAGTVCRVVARVGVGAADGAGEM